MTGKFFRIDREVWAEVAVLGLNPATAYLVLACGTGRDNQTTSWSVNSIENYAGMGRTRARKAIEALIELGAVSQVKDGASPKYFLEPLAKLNRKDPKPLFVKQSEDEQWIWMPNAIVVGAKGEMPPLAKIRSLQDIRTLQLFVALYGCHELAENGGVHWRTIRQKYERKRITERGIWNIWGFNAKDVEVFLDKKIYKIFQPSKINYFGTRRKTEGGSTNISKLHFWASWNQLKRAGLVQIVPHLVEADNSEASVLFPCPGRHDDGEELEKELGERAERAADRLLGDSLGLRMEDYDFVLPVPEGYPKVEMVGIIRLRYRPHTRMTAAWAAKGEDLRNWIDQFDRVGLDEGKRRSPKVATSRKLK